MGSVTRERRSDCLVFIGIRFDASSASTNLAASLQNELSQHVLLEGGTDPVGVKQTHNE